MNNTSEIESYVKRFVIILGVIILVIAIALVLGNTFTSNLVKDYTYTSGYINDEIAIAGTLFNREETEYYVLCYDSEGVNAGALGTYLNYFASEHHDEEDEGYIKIYNLDLANSLNKDYYVKDDEESNRNATKSSELRIKDGTLIKIRKGKIVKYLEGKDAIKKELGIKE